LPSAHPWLSVTDYDVSSKLAWSFEYAKGNWVRADNEQTLNGMNQRLNGAKILDAAEEVRRLHEYCGSITINGFSKLKLTGAELTFSSPFFNEFVVKLPEGSSVSAINSNLLKEGYLGGYDLGRDYPELAGHMLIA